MSELLGVIVLARNGDRVEYHQDRDTYQGTYTSATPLGHVQSYQLGSYLRSTYLESHSSSFIKGLQVELVDNRQVHALINVGGEGTVVFDSAIACLQGLFPPNPTHRIDLANGSTIIAPLNGYQYIPVETVLPVNDRSFESWTNCPAFTRHVANVYASNEFKQQAKEAERFLRRVRDFVFGRPTTLENIWNVYDFVHSELTHNKTYAYRLPPTYVNQARHWANYHEEKMFSSPDVLGIGNIAGRTVLHTLLRSLERVAYDHDPVKFLLVETTYQPFVSLFHQLGIVNQHPEFQGFPNYASALAIELHRGSHPDVQDFLRFKFKNGTKAELETVHVFDHEGDVPLTEFIYRTSSIAIGSNEEWRRACRTSFTYADIPGNFYLWVLFALCVTSLVLLRSIRRWPSNRSSVSIELRAEYDGVSKFA